MAYLDDRQLTRSGGTVYNNASTLNAWLRDAAPEHVDAWTGQMLRDYHRQLRATKTRQGKRRTVGRCNTAVSMILRMWRWAASQPEYRDAVPYPPLVFDLPKAPPKRQRSPSLEELHLLVATAGRPWHRLMLSCAYYTGLRVNQVLRLRWDDLDEHLLTLHLRPELGKSRQERRGRTVPVHPALAAVLRQVEPEAETVIRCRTVPYHALRDAWEAAEVPHEVYASQPNHVFRRGFQVTLRAAGVQPDVIAMLVGHDRGTQGTYIAEDLELMREALTHIPELPRRIRAVV